MAQLTAVRVAYDQEDDGRFIADLVDYPGVMAYGQTREEAFENALAILGVAVQYAEHE